MLGLLMQNREGNSSNKANMALPAPLLWSQAVKGGVLFLRGTGLGRERSF